MARWLSTRIFWITCCAIVSYALPITDENDLVLYLKKIGYLEGTSNVETFAIRAKEAISTALMDSPKSTGLNETGELDNETIKMMNMPKLYLLNNNTERSTRKKRHYPDPVMCQNARLDAITKTASGSVFAFQGHHYWKLNENGIEEESERPVYGDWDTLEGHLDAAFSLPTGETYFFKGRMCWKFYNKVKAQNFPKTIYDEFEGKLPNNIDAAFFSGIDNKAYIFKGKKYWQYDKALDPPVPSGYPKPISEWRCMPWDSVDAVVEWDSSKTYFFKDQKYYKYEHKETSFPTEGSSIGGQWFSCP